MEMEIGTRLKEARESKGMSLEEVQQTTKIQKRYLQAIEKNEFTILPGKFYTRAFIREYASAVGLDPEQVMEEHKSELPTYEEEEVIKYSRVQKSKRESSAKSSRATKLFPIIMTFVVIIGVLFAIWVFYQQATEPDRDATQNDQNEDVVDVPENTQDTNKAQEDNSANEAPANDGEEERDTASQTEDKPKEEQTPTEDPSKTEDSPSESPPKINLVQKGSGSFPEHTYQVTGVEQPSLTIEMTGNTYLEVQAPKNGKNLISPIEYGPGDSPIKVDLKGQNQVYIKTGSAPNITVKVNGQKVQLPAEKPVTQKLLLNFK